MNPSPTSRALVGVFGLGSALTLLSLAAIDPSGSTWALVWVAYAVMATWVLWRQSNNRIGWFMLAIALIFTTITLINWFALSQWGPGPVAVETMSSVLGGVGWMIFLIMVTLFPDGTAVSRSQARLVRVGWLLILLGVVVTVTSGDPLLDTGRAGWLANTAVADVNHTFAPVGAILIGLFPLAVLVSLILRWRASAGVQRQQMKWFLWGTVVTIVTLTIGSATSNSIGPTIVDYAIWVVGGAALPVSIAIAVQRYRLYDIDRVISRTTSYAVVTGLLAALFVTVVALGSSVLGSDNQLAVAAATLFVAALARPLYRKVQRVVDRRFDRARYDGRLTVEAFGLRLSHEVDTRTVVRDLEATVSTTLAPVKVGLWLRETT